MADETTGLLDNMNEGIKSFNDELNSTDNLLGGINSSLKTIASWTGGLAITFGLKDMVSSLMKINNEATKSAAILGKGAFGKSLKESTKDISDNMIMLQKNIGLSTDRAKEFTNAFLSNRITENLNESTAASGMFQNATGAATDSILSMYNEMYHGADLSTKSINAMMADMTKVQHTFGLTEKGMNAVTKQVGKMSVQLRGFGASDQQIKTMTVSMTKFASAVEKVGMSAQEAMGYMDKWMNPDNIEENIGLYAQLGISVEDAMSGNFDAMQSGLQEFSQRIVDMGPIAGQAYAKQFGYTYSQAMKTSKLEGLGDVEQTAEENALSTLKEMDDEATGITGKIEKFFNSIKGELMKFGPLVLGVISLGAAFIKKNLRITESDIDRISKKTKTNFSVGTSAEAAATGVGMAANYNKVNKSASSDGNDFINTGSLKADIDIWGAQLTNAYRENAKQESLNRYQVLEIEKQTLLDKAKSTEDLLASLGNNISVSTKETLENNARTAKNAANELQTLISSLASKNSAVANQILEEAKKQMVEKATNKTGSVTKLNDLTSKIDITSSVMGAKGNGAQDIAARKQAEIDFKKLVGGTKDVEGAFEILSKGAENLSARDFYNLKNMVDKNSPLGKAIEELKNAKLEEIKATNDLTNAEKNVETAKNKKEPGFAGVFFNQFGIVRGAKKIGTGIYNAFDKSEDNEKSWRNRWNKYKTLNGGGKAVAGKITGKVVGGTTKVALKGVAGLAKGLGKLSLAMGVASLAMNLIQKIMEPMQEDLQGLMESVKDQFSPLLDSLSGAFKDIMPTVQGVLEEIIPVAKDLFGIFIDIANKIMPPLINLVKTLIINVLIPLVKSLLPPILRVLSLLVRVLQGITWLLSKMLIGKGVREAMGNLSSNLGDAADALWQGADQIKTNNKIGREQVSLEKKKQENKSDLDNGGATWSVNNDGAIAEKGNVRAMQSLNDSQKETKNAVNEGTRATNNLNSNITATNQVLADLMNQIINKLNYMTMPGGYVNTKEVSS